MVWKETTELANVLYQARLTDRETCYKAFEVPILLNLNINLTFANRKNNSYNQLITFLNEKGITRAYANYWISYPITFISKENIIVAPYKFRDVQKILELKPDTK